MEEAVEPNRELARRRGLELEVEEVDAERPLEVDRRLTVSAVHNLLDNAIKYSDHGPVQLWTEGARRARRTSERPVSRQRRA